MSIAIGERLRFNTAQAAEYADRHPDTIRKALAAGELHGGQARNADGSPKKNSSWSIRRECLDAWLDGIACPHKGASP